MYNDSMLSTMLLLENIYSDCWNITQELIDKHNVFVRKPIWIFNMLLSKIKCLLAIRYFD